MTLEELRNDNHEFIFVSHICPDIIPCNPNSFRREVRKNPDKIPFPVLIIGVKLYIGRRGFLAFLDAAGVDERYPSVKTIISGDVTR